MKTLPILITVILTLFLTISCEKGNENSIESYLQGKWTDTSNFMRYIEFFDDYRAVINGVSFLYSVDAESITFFFNGEDLIQCAEEATHMYTLDNRMQLLSIENMDDLCMAYNKNKKGITVYSRQIIPNKFVGNWVSADYSDTLSFITNTYMELHRELNFAWYKYSYDDDSITIKYGGPDKILVMPNTYGYKFTGDTLNINFDEIYYPDIQVGLKKYLFTDRL